MLSEHSIELVRYWSSTTGKPNVTKLLLRLGEVKPGDRMMRDIRLVETLSGQRRYGLVLVIHI